MCLISAEVLLKRIHGDTSTEPLPTPLERSAGAPPRVTPAASTRTPTPTAAG
jgi:hypothetical protein